MSRRHSNLLEAYLHYTRGHEGTPKIHQWALISVVAASLERKVWLDRGFYTLYPNMYVLIIGKSGAVKKSTSTATALKLYRELPGANIMAERCTAMSLIKQLWKAGREFAYEGRDVMQSPCFAYASELAVFLETISGNLLELLTTFYDCVPNDPKVPWTNSYNNKSMKDLRIFGPCLNMLGCSTKAWLQKCIPKKQQAGGFASRCIFVVENELPKNLVAWPEITQAQRRNYGLLVQDLKHIHKLTGEFKVTDGARALFTRWYEYHMKNVMVKNLDERMVGYMSRKGDHILKIAMVHSVMNRDSLEITETDIAWATTELTKLEEHWRTIFDDKPEYKATSLPFEIRSYVRKRVKVPMKELYTSFAEYTGVEVDAAIETLRGMGEVIDINVVPTGEVDATPHLTFIGSDLNLL